MAQAREASTAGAIENNLSRGAGQLNMTLQEAVNELQAAAQAISGGCLWWQRGGRAGSSVVTRDESKHWSGPFVRDGLCAAKPPTPSLAAHLTCEHVISRYLQISLSISVKKYIVLLMETRLRQIGSPGCLEVTSDRDVSR